MNIKIVYNGEYPNLCSGNLVCIIDGKRWYFPDFCLMSGGEVSFDDNCHEHVTIGDWRIREYPEGFPEHLKDAVVDAVNNNVEHGCCGGCG